MFDWSHLRTKRSDHCGPRDGGLDSLRPPDPEAAYGPGLWLVPLLSFFYRTQLNPSCYSTSFPAHFYMNAVELGRALLHLHQSTCIVSYIDILSCERRQGRHVSFRLPRCLGNMRTAVLKDATAGMTCHPGHVAFSTTTTKTSFPYATSCSWPPF